MQRKYSGFLSLILIGSVLVACGDSATSTTQSGVTNPTAPGGGGAAPTLTTAPVAVNINEMPKNLRTDLKGQSIKVILDPDGPAKTWEEGAVKKFTDVTGINVKIIAGDTSASDRIATYKQQLQAKSTDADVYMIDVIWPGILAEYAQDLTPTLGDTTKGMFQAIVQNNTVNGKLVAIPWYTDAGLLYYRTDLLKKYGYTNPPTTWDELEQMAKKIQDGERASNKDFWGYVWQGKAYEGLSCNALEWQVSQGGGTIIDQNTKKVTINNDNAVKAFNRAKGWVGTISPPGVTTYQEEEARNIWQAGNSAFMRNWPYAFSLGQTTDSAIKDKFDVTLLPKGSGDGARNADTLGGWQLMLSQYSKNKDASVEFIKFMTSREVQKAYAIDQSHLPVIPELYDDADVLKANPYYKPLKAVFSGGAVARPSTVSSDNYNKVSTDYFQAVNQILTGQKEAKAALTDLETKLNKDLQ